MPVILLRQYDRISYTRSPRPFLNGKGLRRWHKVELHTFTRFSEIYPTQRCGEVFSEAAEVQAYSIQFIAY